MKKQPANAGFSIIEVLVGLGLGGLAMLFAIQYFQGFTRVGVYRTATADMQVDMKRAVDYLSSKVFMAGYGIGNGTAFSGSSGQALNARMVARSMPPCQDGDTLMYRFFVDGSARLMAETRCNGNVIRSKRLLKEVDHLGVEFFDARGQPIADTLSIQTVEFTIRTESSRTFAGDTLSRTITSRVTPRNLIL